MHRSSHVCPAVEWNTGLTISQTIYADTGLTNQGPTAPEQVDAALNNWLISAGICPFMGMSFPPARAREEDQAPPTPAAVITSCSTRLT